jgi:phosphate/sulfate permease
MITELLVAGAAAVAVGVWLKWASRPVVIAYWLGREITHLRDRQSAGREAVRTRSR